MIPAEAVEASLKVWWDDLHAEGPQWASLTIGEREFAASNSLAREMLEAAAPHMLAAAWKQGAQAGFDVTREGFNGECAFDHCAPDDYPLTNPYSGEPWDVNSVEA